PRQPVEGNPVRTPFTTTVNTDWLPQVLRQAQRFTDWEGTPPVWRGYGPNSETGEEVLVCYVLLSSAEPTVEHGYSAPVLMLIGVNLDNQITGIKILHYV